MVNCDSDRVEQSGIFVPLTMGQKTIIDADDYERVSKNKWQAHKRNCPSGGYYARKYVKNHNGKNTNIYLHRFIVGSIPKGMEVDHKNGDTLDNRKCNLRICRTIHNNWNVHRRKSSSTGYTGVYRTRKRYRARFRHNYKNLTICTFYTAEGAAVAYDTAIKRLRGEYAVTNFAGPVKRKDIRKVIARTKGRCFCAIFIKRDGTLRRLNARIGVKKGTNGKGLKFKPSRKRLISVYDMSKREHRFISVMRILSLKVGNKKYYVRENLYDIESKNRKGCSNNLSALF